MSSSSSSSSSKASTLPQLEPQTHEYYLDDIPDTKLNTLDPELAAHFAQHGVPKIPPLSLDQVPHFRKGHLKSVHRFNTSAFARKVLGLPASTDPSSTSSAVRATLPWSENDITIPVRDGTHIPARIYLPQPRPPRPLPVVLFFHGGGWFMGNLTSDALINRLLTTHGRCLVIDAYYRQYPEVSFPTQTTDCHDAVRWTARHAHHFEGDCRLGFVLAGNSGGATYAAIAAHLARDESLTPPVTGQWLACPVLPDNVGPNGQLLFDRTRENRSQEQHADAPLINRAMEQSIYQLAKMTSEDYGSPLFTPFLFDNHASLGEGGIYIQITGIDPWRDSARIYAGLCERAGNRVKTDIYPGLPHGWWQKFPHLSATEVWARNAVEGLSWLFRGSERTDGDGKDKANVSAKL